MYVHVAANNDVCKGHDSIMYCTKKFWQSFFFVFNILTLKISSWKNNIFIMFVISIHEKKLSYMTVKIMCTLGTIVSSDFVVK